MVRRLLWRQLSKTKIKNTIKDNINFFFSKIKEPNRK